MQHLFIVDFFFFNLFFYGKLWKLNYVFVDLAFFF